MKLNLKIRFKNPIFIIQLVSSIIFPILAYMGLTLQDLTSWTALGRVIFSALGNPYILCLVIINVFSSLQDPTTIGISDSQRALTYDEPSK